MSCCEISPSGEGNIRSFAFGGQARRRAQAKASALIEMVEAVSEKHEELKKFSNGREDYKNRAEESFDRIFENTLREIETLNVSLRNKRFFAEQAAQKGGTIYFLNFARFKMTS